MKKSKGLNKANWKVSYPMNKRGVIAEVVIATSMIIITLVGVIYVLTESNKIIVGDISTHLYYEYSKCPNDIQKISEKNKIILSSENKAVEEGFTIGC